MSKVLQRSTTLSIAAAIVLIDQLSKAALSAVLVDGKTMTAIPGILSLQLVHNSGAAFSLFSRSTELLGLPQPAGECGDLGLDWATARHTALARLSNGMPIGRNAWQWLGPLAPWLCGGLPSARADQLPHLQRG